MEDRDNDEAVNHVDKDALERQLINERTIHQQIVSSLELQLAQAKNVRALVQNTFTLTHTRTYTYSCRLLYTNIFYSPNKSIQVSIMSKHPHIKS